MTADGLSWPPVGAGRRGLYGKSFSVALDSELERKH